MTKLLRRNLKPAGEGEVPDEQVLIYRTCECCRQSMPLDSFGKRGRPTKTGERHIDTVCKYCREIQERESRKFVRQNARRVDSMMLNLVEAIVDEPMDEFEDIPDIGTLTRQLLRPFGGAKGLGLQMASSYLSSPPGSPCRQHTHNLLVKLDMEATKLGYAKKPKELMSDEELDLYIKEQQQRLLKQANGEEEVKAEDAGNS